MVFRVRNTRRAKSDLDGILARLPSEGAGEAGLRWFQGLHEAIASLARLPKRCPLAPENRSFPSDVRQLLYGRRQHRYRILFTIEATPLLFFTSAMVAACILGISTKRSPLIPRASCRYHTGRPGAFRRPQRANL